METRRRHQQKSRCSLHQTACSLLLLMVASIIPFSHCETELNRISSPKNDASTITQTKTTLSSSSTNSSTNSSELDELESVLTEYVNDALDRNYNAILSELTPNFGEVNASTMADARQVSQQFIDQPGLSEFDRKIIRGLARFIDQRFFGAGSSSGSSSRAANSSSNGEETTQDAGRAVESGRLFFFKGLKKIVWPLLFGLQIVKTVLLVLFLPSIIGSLGKIVGKGLTSVSSLSHPAATVEDLDFKDNSYNSDQDFNMNMDNNNGYLPSLDAQPAGTSFNPMYDAANNANSALSRLGFGGGRVTYVNSANDYNRQQKRNDFKIFHDIPSSSLLLTNYDPFYSPLLSRLDSVYAQFGLSSKEEACREKLVCLMYANPAKYAPYSNLISAQLSRELNELRKPTNDNPDILRFFKYMRAAKDGQDGVDCDRAHKDCVGYQELSNPAMVATFNDINKLVQARKLL